MTRLGKASLELRRLPIVVAALGSALVRRLVRGGPVPGVGRGAEGADDSRKRQIDERPGPLQASPRPDPLASLDLVTNAGYDSNVFATSTDPTTSWTATVAAGTRVLLPMGTKMYLVGDVFPQYTWYANLTVRDRWGGTYDAAILGFFNRLKLPGGRGGSAELRALQLGASGVRLLQHPERQGKRRGRPDPLPLAHSPREATRRCATRSTPALRSRTSRSSSTTATTPKSAAGSATRSPKTGTSRRSSKRSARIFQFQSELRDNQSTGYLGSITFNVPRLFINAIGGYRDGRSLDGSAYPGIPDRRRLLLRVVLSLALDRVADVRSSAGRLQHPGPPALLLRQPGRRGREHRVLRPFPAPGLRGGRSQRIPGAGPGSGEGLVDRVDHVKYYGGGFSDQASGPDRADRARRPGRSCLRHVPDQIAQFSDRFTAFLNFNGEYSR